MGWMEDAVQGAQQEQLGVALGFDVPGELRLPVDERAQVRAGQLGQLFQRGDGAADVEKVLVHDLCDVGVGLGEEIQMLLHHRLMGGHRFRKVEGETAGHVVHGLPPDGCNDSFSFLQGDHLLVSLSGGNTGHCLSDEGWIFRV